MDKAIQGDVGKIPANIAIQGRRRSMNNIIRLLHSEGYDRKVSHALAGASGYLRRAERWNPDKTYTVQEVQALVKSLQDIAENEYGREMAG